MVQSRCGSKLTGHCKEETTSSMSLSREIALNCEKLSGQYGSHDKKKKRRKASHINGLQAYEGIYNRW